MRLEELREIEGRMTPGPWVAGSIAGAWRLDDGERCIARPAVHENSAEDIKGIAITRNHLPALLDVAEAAECPMFAVERWAGVSRKPEPCGVCAVCAALARLEAVR